MSEQPIKHKHHHVPVFHLKKWHGEDGKFFVYRKYGDGRLQTQKAVATEYFFERDLYLLREDMNLILTRNFRADFVEDKLAKDIDDKAALVFERLLTVKTLAELSTDERKIWARYVHSLLHRTPKTVKETDEQIEKIFLKAADELRQGMSCFEGGETEAEEIIDDYRQSGSYLNFGRISLVDERLAEPWIEKVLELRWIVWRITSDNPRFIMSPNPVLHFGTLLGVPLTPNSLWLAFPEKWMKDPSLERVIWNYTILYNGKVVFETADYFVSQSELDDRFLYKWKEIKVQALKRQGQSDSCDSVE